MSNDYFDNSVFYSSYGRHALETLELLRKVVLTPRPLPESELAGVPEELIQQAIGNGLMSVERDLELAGEFLGPTVAGARAYLETSNHMPTAKGSHLIPGVDAQLTGGMVVAAAFLAGIIRAAWTDGSWPLWAKLPQISFASAMQNRIPLGSFSTMGYYERDDSDTKIKPLLRLKGRASRGVLSPAGVCLESDTLTNGLNINLTWSELWDDPSRILEYERLVAGV